MVIIWIIVSLASISGIAMYWYWHSAKHSNKALEQLERRVLQVQGDMELVAYTGDHTQYCRMWKVQCVKVYRGGREIYSLEGNLLHLGEWKIGDTVGHLLLRRSDTTFELYAVSLDPPRHFISLGSYDRSVVKVVDIRDLSTELAFWRQLDGADPDTLEAFIASLPPVIVVKHADGTSFYELILKDQQLYLGPELNNGLSIFYGDLHERWNAECMVGCGVPCRATHQIKTGGGRYTSTTRTEWTRYTKPESSYQSGDESFSLVETQLDRGRYTITAVLKDCTWLHAGLGDKYRWLTHVQDGHGFFSDDRLKQTITFDPAKKYEIYYNRTRLDPHYVFYYQTDAGIVVVNDGEVHSYTGFRVLEDEFSRQRLRLYHDGERILAQYSLRTYRLEFTRHDVSVEELAPRRDRHYYDEHCPCC